MISKKSVLTTLIGVSKHILIKMYNRMMHTKISSLTTFFHVIREISILNLSVSFDFIIFYLMIKINLLNDLQHTRKVSKYQIEK